MCRSKMHLVLLAILLATTLTTGAALQLLRLDVPPIADPRWEKVALRCDYDLGDEELYSVKWYKDGAEFFRFMPRSIPPGRDFGVDGVVVDMSRSDSKQVTLLGQTNLHGSEVNLAGTYGCEVSTEAPTFLTTYGEANMSVAVPPKFPPVLEGLRPNYEVGESLQAECTSAPSYPPSAIAFILNGREVNRAFTYELPENGHVDDNMISSTRLGLKLHLERQHFPGGSLTLICQANLPGIPSTKPLKSEESATLAASNERLAQEPPKSEASCSFSIFASTVILAVLTVQFGQ